ncbi:uncharacterized protein LOC107271703 [Cephus cinctus]|uniref:Uncharacterized protein LOC107271703 n=1 Tax=Cephus cinctus TaxID=211228 RepID=A0AAJ7C759_CEPCN|nr:uncharacterized protein LOC107271703 [Cephus cinctus]
MKWPLILVWFLSSSSSILAAPTEESTRCEFPSHWRGSWFQSGVPGLVTINGSIITNKGQCVAVGDGDKFLVQDQEKCYRCIVMHEKHRNVLQYKETYCLSDRPNPKELCSELAGDAALFSLFRVGAPPTSCPFKGPLEFTYVRGDHECRTPASSAETCTQESRLLLRYQACADVPSTESTQVELECLAAWREGSTQYLVARLHSERIDNDENRYRCFIYAKKTADTWTLSQSGDATCNGLTGVNDGAKILTMRQKPASEGCEYPHWMVSAGTWVALDSVARLLVSPRNLTIRDRNETRFVCHRLISSDKPSTQSNRQVTLVAKATRECENGYVCLIFHERDGYVIEMQQSERWTQQPDEACSSNAFNPLATPYTTFITSEPLSRTCPHFGRYEVISATKSRPIDYMEKVVAPESEQNPEEEVDSEFPEVKASSPSSSPRRRCDHANVRGLHIGCRSPDSMEFSTTCSDETTFVYSCHGTWVENDTVYLVASTEAGRYCLIYTTPTSVTPSTDLSVTGHLASCPRASHPSPRISHPHQHVWQVNLTAYAQCGETSSAISWASEKNDHFTLFGVLTCAILSRYIER